MSRRLVTLVYDRRVGSVHRKAILAYMADRASDNGCGVWASKQTIAEETECGRSTVIKIIREFVDEGLLIEVGTRRCANGATIIYDLDVARIAALPTFERAESHNVDPSAHGAPPVHQRDPMGSTSGTRTDPDGSTSGTPPVHQRDPMGSTSGTLTVHEPSLNQRTNVLLHAPPAKVPRKRATAIAEDAVISERQIQIASEEGHGDDEARAQFSRFKSSALAKNRTYVNWDAAWRNWFNSPYFRPITNGDGYENRAGNVRDLPYRRKNRSDPAAEQIARLAGLGTTSRNGGA